MEALPVKNEKFLIRDIHSKAIINTNHDEILESKTKIALARHAKRKTESMEKDIASLKQQLNEFAVIKNEINEIKTILKRLIEVKA